MIRRALLLCAACVVWAGFAADAAAQYANDPNVLWEQVTLYRDEWGVPHVYANNPRAMAFALGYAQAEDHMETMSIAYRVAKGRASELFGEEYVASDEMALRLGHDDLARAAYANADSLTRDLCEGFALGANSWLIENLAGKPNWVEAISPPDVLALLHAYLMSMAPLDVAGAWKRPRGTPSANAWAVSPKLSDTGEATLVINPHENYDDVFRWYEVHLATHDVNVSGATLFGLPFILQGHNASLGWALAPNEPDFADVYLEPETYLPPVNPNAVNANGLDIVLAHELYKLQDVREYYVRTDAGLERRHVQRRQTPRGPIIGRQRGQGLSHRIGGYNEFGTLRQLYAMGAAGDLRAFQKALSMRQLPCFHIVYADKEGNIFYLYNATVGEKMDVQPIQNAGFASYTTVSPWDQPLSAVDSNSQWGDLIPITSLPALLSPESGYVQACATVPWLATEKTGAGPGDWPLWFARDTDSYRAKRVRQLLGQGPRSFADHQSMLYDLVAPFAVEAVSFLLEAAARHGGFMATSHPDLDVALDMLRDWNYLADPKSTAMTYFHMWWSTFCSMDPAAMHSETELYELIRENNPAIQQHALRAADRAVMMLKNEFQTLNVPWGEAHTLTRGDRTVPLGGATSGEPLFRASDQHFEKGQWPVTAGYGFAMVVRFGNTPHAASMVPFGTSEVATSEHYDDQLDLLLEGRLKLTHYDRRDVESHAAVALGKSMYLRSPNGDASFLVRAAAPVKARLEATAKMAEALPLGYASFSPHLEPVVEPRAVDLEITMEIRVPEELCAASDLNRLQVSAYSPSLGWMPVAEQRLDSSSRTFSARVSEPRIFALIGPQEIRRFDPGDFQPERRMKTPTVPSPRGFTPLLEHDGYSGAVSEKSQSVADRADPSEKSREVSREDFQVTRNFNTRLKPAPSQGTGDPFAQSVQREASPAEVPEAPPVPVVEQPEPSDGTETLSQPSPPEAANFGTPREVEPEPKPEPKPEPEPSPDPRAVPEEAPRRAETPSTETQPAILAEEQPVEATTAAKPAEKKRAIWSMESPVAMRGKQPAASKNLFLAPKNAIQSPLAIGDSLELSPPVPGANFHVRTNRTVRAQIMATEEPPAPLPEGLAQFSYVFSVMVDQWNVEGSTLVSIQINPALIEEKNVGALRLYAFDETAGWQLIEDVRAELKTATFRKLDMALRSYAILGPADYFLGDR